MFGHKSGGGLGRGVGPAGNAGPNELDPYDETRSDMDEGFPDEQPSPAPRQEKRNRLKSRKAGRVREAEPDINLQARLSRLVMMEALPGFTKQDAIDNARHYAISLVPALSNCFYFVQEVPGGFMVEVQEGVGHAYLPSAVKLAMEHPSRTIVVPMLHRYMTVHYAPRTGTFDVQTLPEGQDPSSIGGQEPLMAERGPAMTPVTKQEKEWLVTGLVTAAVGCIALVTSLTFYALDPDTRMPPSWRTMNTAQLPIMQWSTLMEGDGSSYVVRMEYSDGAWRTVRQNADAVVEVAPVTDGAVLGPDGLPVPGVPAVAPGAEGLPAPVPGAPPAPVNPGQ